MTNHYQGFDKGVKNKNIFLEDLHWATPGLWGELGGRWNHPKNRFLSGNVIFRGHRLFPSHFGQLVPESPVSQLQNGVSTLEVAIGCTGNSRSSAIIYRVLEFMVIIN